MKVSLHGFKIKKAMGFAPMALACSKQTYAWVRANKIKVKKA